MTAVTPEPRMLVDLETDGALTAPEREALRRQLASDPDLAAERRRSQALQKLLQEQRVVARQGFAAEVMAVLPVAPRWRPQTAGWRVAAAVAAALGLAAAGSVWLAGGELGPGLGAVLALAELVAVAVVAGAGLLHATWQGLGAAVAETLTLTQQVVLGAGVLALDLLLVALLRRRRHAASESTEQRPR